MGIETGHQSAAADGGHYLDAQGSAKGILKTDAASNPAQHAHGKQQKSRKCVFIEYEYEQEH